VTYYLTFASLLIVNVLASVRHDLRQISYWAVLLGLFVFVVKKLVEFISHYGFAPFAWWRIIIGGVCLGFLGLGY